MVPKGANIIRTSFSFNFLLSMPMNSLRSSTATKVNKDEKRKYTSVQPTIKTAVFETVLPEYFIFNPKLGGLGCTANHSSSKPAVAFLVQVISTTQSTATAFWAMLNSSRFRISQMKYMGFQTRYENTCGSFSFSSCLVVLSFYYQCLTSQNCIFMHNYAKFITNTSAIRQHAVHITN